MRCRKQVLFLSLLFAGCGGLRSAVRYQGSEEPSIVRPEELREVSSLPEDYDELGKISASCTLNRTPGAIDGEWLSDVDCSEQRLRRAIREKAADAGGELLVGLGCWSRGDADDSEIDIVCRGEVARPSDELLERRSAQPRSAQSDVEREPQASEAWRIRVSFTPNPGVPARHARRADMVREVPNFPVSHVRLGDVVTDCERGCSFDAVRSGVLLAAAHVGATDVVSVSCSARGDGWVCSGTATAYEVEPELDKRAQ
jgi:hypothetical protein